MNFIDTAHVRTANSKDFDAVVKLLQSENLPAEDISGELQHFFVIEERGQIVAAIGLEIYGKDALLRSMIVHHDYRGRSLASVLLKALLKHAAEQKITSIYLITTTAERYFAKKDFVVVERNKVPSSITATQEFSTLCPSTATVMLKQL